VIEVITEPKGQLHFGPPKTSAGRRMVGLPRFVVDALAERMATPGGPGRPCLGQLHPGRYGHLYPEADLTLRERLDAI
jgi:hypothetical protein